jgi:hypothetical protein
VTVNGSVGDLPDLSEEGFRETFRGGTVKRAKRQGLLRNAASARSVT